MKWTFENGIPIYMQILRRLRTEIASGAYPPGAKLPPVRELALEAGVNPNTMQRAFAELDLRKTLSDDVIEEMCGRLIRLGMSRQEIRSAVEAWASANGTEADE